MKKFLINLNFLLLFLVVSPHITSGCSFARNSMSKFPSEWFVFIGEVIAYTDKISSNKFLNDANGLKIKVLESVNLPKKSSDYFEVFPFGLAPDCTDLGLYKDELEEYYPVHSKVRVIAVEAKMLPDKNRTGQIRLEAPRLFSVFRNDLNSETSSTVNSLFNYASLNYAYLNRPHEFLLDFELLKDLKRLEESETELEKVVVFERLANLPQEWFDFEPALRNYIKSSEIKEKLINKKSKIERFKDAKNNDRRF